MIHNRCIALIYRCASFILITAGILAISNAFTPKFSGVTFLYYTLQSNILVLILFGYLTIRTIFDLKKQGANGSADYAPACEMVCSVDIFLTFLVYWVLLAPSAFSMGNTTHLFSFANLAVHAITPLLCIIDYIFFTGSHKLKRHHIFLPLIFPLLYFAVMSIAGACGFVLYIDTNGLPVNYPYFFFDFGKIGGMVIVYVVALIALFVSLSFGLYMLDKKWDKKVLIPKRKTGLGD